MELGGAGGTIGAQPWPEWLPTAVIHSRYLDYCLSLRINAHRRTEEEIGTLLRKHIGATAERRRQNGEQARGHVLPSLKEARQLFDKSTGRGSRQWDDDEPEQLTIDKAATT